MIMTYPKNLIEQGRNCIEAQLQGRLPLRGGAGRQRIGYRVNTIGEHTKTGCAMSGAAGVNNELTVVKTRKFPYFRFFRSSAKGL